MKRRTLMAAIVLLPLPALSQATLPDPQGAVRAFYDRRIPLERRPYSRSLAELYAAAQKKSRELDEPVSGLDFDPATGSQDADEDFRKTLRFRTLSRDATRAIVEVGLRVFKTEKPITLTYELVFEQKAWRVNDIARLAPGEDGWRLSTLLAAGAKGE